MEENKRKIGNNSCRTELSLESFESFVLPESYSAFHRMCTNSFAMPRKSWCASVYVCELRETCSGELPNACDVQNHDFNRQPNEEQASTCSTLFLVTKNIRSTHCDAFRKWKKLRIRRFLHMNRQHILLFDKKHLRRVCAAVFACDRCLFTFSTRITNESQAFAVSLSCICGDSAAAMTDGKNLMNSNGYKRTTIVLPTFLMEFLGDSGADNKLF